jgi:integrase
VCCIETQADTGLIRAYLVVDWTTSTQRGASGAAQRLVRGFLTYLRAILPETEVPNSGLVRAFRRPKLYLFTVHQLTALIRAAQDLGPRGSCRPQTFATFLGVLASTGLRVGEAIRLTVQDVHLDATPPVVHSRETTFHKSRVVPLQPTTVVPLRRDRAVRTALHAAALSDVFFVSELGQALTHDALGRWFAQLCRQLGLAPTAGGRRPSLHALRHAFAMERLRRWHRDGMDVQALLPHLSVSLGHVRPQESSWYLTATPALLSAAALRFQQYAARGEAS